MDFMLSMFIFANGEYFTREGQEMEEALRGCHASNVDKNRGVAVDQGKPQQQKEPQAQLASGAQQEKRQQGIKPWLALEFDGLNCFETFVSHH